MCPVSPCLPAPKGSISKLHLFEGFLIWGLGQPRPTVPSSIIPAEEQSGGEGVERRRKTGGDRVISYLSSLSPTRPIATNFLSLHLFHLSLTRSSCFSISLSLAVSPSIVPSYLSIPSTLTCILSASL